MIRPFFLCAKDLYARSYVHATNDRTQLFIMMAASNASSLPLILTITLSIVLSYHIVGIYGFSLTKSANNCHSHRTNFRIPSLPVLRVTAKQNTQHILPKLDWLGMRDDRLCGSFKVVYKSIVKTLWFLKQNAQQYDNDDDDDSNLQQDIDAFLSGEYDRPFADDAPAPYPGLSPRKTIEAVLESLQQINNPEPAHGAAVLQRFCAPLGRGERWGGGSVHKDPWKEVLRCVNLMCLNAVE